MTSPDPFNLASLDDLIASQGDEPIDGMFSSPEDDEESAGVPLVDAEPYRIPRGKYAGIVLPRMIGVKPSELERIEAIKSEIRNDPEFQAKTSTIAHTYAVVRAEVQAIKADLKEAEDRLKAIGQILADQCEVEDVPSLTIGSFQATVRVQPEPHTLIIDRAGFASWCRANGYADLMSLPWATANRITKERLLAGKKEPDGASAFMRRKIVYTPMKDRK